MSSLGMPAKCSGLVQLLRKPCVRRTYQGTVYSFAWDILAFIYFYAWVDEGWQLQWLNVQILSWKAILEQSSHLLLFVHVFSAEVLLKLCRMSDFHNLLTYLWLVLLLRAGNDIQPGDPDWSRWRGQWWQSSDSNGNFEYYWYTSQCSWRSQGSK